MTSPVGPREAGFTLLEMLVALVVFGLVMAGLAQSFRFGLTAWHLGARETVVPEDMAALDMALSRMVAQALPGSMAGGAHRLAFTTSLPAGAGLGGGLADAAILVAPGGEVMLRYGAHPPGVPLAAAAPARDESLASGVAGLGFSYLVRRAGQPATWSGTWSGGGLPALIRIHFDLADGRSWPDLVVAPVAAGP